MAALLTLTLRLDVGLQQLVPDRGRFQRVDVPGLRHTVSSTDARLPVRGLRRRGTARHSRASPLRRPEMPPAKPPRQQAGAISTILNGLRRAPRRMRRGSRDVIENAVSQLFDAAVATARRRGVRRVPHRRARPAGGHHDPQHPGVPRPRPAASAAAGRPHRAVQRHPPDPAAADHLDARPRLQHRPCARDALRVGAGQGSRRHARSGDRRSPAAGPPRNRERMSIADAQAVGRRRPRFQPHGRARASSGSRTARTPSSCGPN